MTITPELLALLAQPETRQAIAFNISFSESELPEAFKPGRLDPWQREVWQNAQQLRRLHQALSPNNLNAVGNGTPLLRPGPPRPDKEQPALEW